jgi:arylformamidase
MKRIIDLTHDIVSGMPVFPDDPEVAITNWHSHQDGGYCVSQLTLGSHTGTHVDVPYHKFAAGESVDRVPLEKFFGRALIIDLTYLEPGAEIKVADLINYQADLKDCRIVILHTDWSEHFGREDFFTGFPGISLAAAKWLVDQEIGLVGLESPSVHPTEHDQVHECFLQKGILIIENLNHVKLIKNKFVDFYATPLKLQGLDASPVRAFAVVETNI